MITPIVRRGSLLKDKIPPKGILSRQKANSDYKHIEISLFAAFKSVSNLSSFLLILIAWCGILSWELNQDLETPILSCHGHPQAWDPGGKYWVTRQMGRETLYFEPLQSRGPKPPSGPLCVTRLGTFTEQEIPPLHRAVCRNYSSSELHHPEQHSKTLSCHQYNETDEI